MPRCKAASHNNVVWRHAMQQANSDMILGTTQIAKQTVQIKKFKERSHDRTEAQDLA